MIAEAEALMLAFERGEDTQADLESFKARYDIHPRVTTPALLGDARTWSHRDELATVCPVKERHEACSPTIVIPPGGAADVGIRIVPSVGSESGVHRKIHLRLTEVSH
jgi:hypothetical protein